MEVSQYTSLDVVASMDKEGVSEYNAGVVRSAADVLALDFDLSPAIIERVVQIGLYDEV
jgi:hypothetical protein